MITHRERKRLNDVKFENLFQFYHKIDIENVLENVFEFSFKIYFRENILKTNMSQNIEKITNAHDIVNIEQLQYWVRYYSQEFLEFIRHFRVDHDIVVDTINNYNEMCDMIETTRKITHKIVIDKNIWRKKHEIVQIENINLKDQIKNLEQTT